MTEYTAHPAADAFPMMDDERYKDLLGDIKKNGQMEAITLADGKILDGRNRYKACLELGIEPKTKEFDGDPWAYVWSLNGQRRDLVKEQRYLIWKFCHEQSATFQAERKRIQEEANRKRSEAMQGLPYVPKGEERKPEKVVGHFVPLLLGDNHKARQSKSVASFTNPGAVARGDKLAKERPDLAKAVMRGEIKPAEAHRLMRKDAVAGKVASLPDGKYRVIYADPPWKYNDAQAVKGEFGTGTGAANCHYPSMTMSELKALDIPSLAADDCVLFLWATSPLIEDALDLAKNWGFQYKAMFVWDKVKHNMGHYNSVRHELLLICTKGSCTPDNVKLFDSVQVIERTDHSSKPEAFREIIDTLYQHGKKIELFNRGGAPSGWNTWGNESA